MTNEARLKQIKQQSDEIFEVVTAYRNRQSWGNELGVRDLQDAVDYLTRVVGMFVERELDVHQEIHDPLGYIEGKLSLAHAHIVRKDRVCE